MNKNSIGITIFLVIIEVILVLFLANYKKNLDTSLVCLPEEQYFQGTLLYYIQGVFFVFFSILIIAMALYKARSGTNTDIFQQTGFFIVMGLSVVFGILLYFLKKKMAEMEKDELKQDVTYAIGNLMTSFVYYALIMLMIIATQFIGKKLYNNNMLSAEGINDAQSIVFTSIMYYFLIIIGFCITIILKPDLLNYFELFAGFYFIITSGILFILNGNTKINMIPSIGMSIIVFLFLLKFRTTIIQVRDCSRNNMQPDMRLSALELLTPFMPSYGF